MRLNKICFRKVYSYEISNEYDNENKNVKKEEIDKKLWSEGKSESDDEKMKREKEKYEDLGVMKELVLM